MAKLSRNLKLYLIAVYLLALSFLIYLIFAFSFPPASAIFIFGFLVVLAELFAVELSDEGAVSVSFAVVFTALLLFGPLGAVLAYLFGTITLQDIKKKIPWYIWLFNASQFILYPGIAGLVYAKTGGIILSLAKRSFLLSDFPHLLLPLFLAMAMAYLINAFLLSVLIALEKKKSPWEVWLLNFKWTAPNYFLLGIFGFFLAHYYSRGPLGFLLFLLALFGLVYARQLFQFPEKQRKFKEESAGMLIRTVETKDPYTAGHSERVAKYAVEIAKDKEFNKKYKISEKNFEAIVRTAKLHDLGKMAIPKRILNKPGRLTEEEYEKVKTHPEEGNLIIEKLRPLKETREGILYHHERLDGQGYAKGLKDGSIPLIARIIAVADSFDAMISDRPYRKALPKKEALGELFRRADFEFNRDMVEALARVLNR